MKISTLAFVCLAGSANSLIVNSGQNVDYDNKNGRYISEAIVKRGGRLAFLNFGSVTIDKVHNEGTFVQANDDELTFKLQDSYYNSGLFVFDGPASDATDISINPSTFINENEFKLTLRSPSMVEIQSTGEWTNNGSIEINSLQSSGQQSIKLGGRSSARLTNNGAICLYNALWNPYSITGKGCINVGNNSTIHLKGTANDVGPEQTIYLSEKNSQAIVNFAAYRRRDWKGNGQKPNLVRGFQNGNRLTLTFPVATLNYDKKLGILSGLSGEFATENYAFDIGTQYDAQNFEIIDKRTIIYNKEAPVRDVDHCSCGFIDVPVKSSTLSSSTISSKSSLAPSTQKGTTSKAIPSQSLSSSLSTSSNKKLSSSSQSSLSHKASSSSQSSLSHKASSSAERTQVSTDRVSTLTLNLKLAEKTSGTSSYVLSALSLESKIWSSYSNTTLKASTSSSNALPSSSAVTGNSNVPTSSVKSLESSKGPESHSKDSSSRSSKSPSKSSESSSLTEVKSNGATSVATTSQVHSTTTSRSHIVSKSSSSVVVTDPRTSQGVSRSASKPSSSKALINSQTSIKSESSKVSKESLKPSGSPSLSKSSSQLASSRPVSTSMMSRPSASKSQSNISSSIISRHVSSSSSTISATSGLSSNSKSTLKSSELALSSLTGASRSRGKSSSESSKLSESQAKSTLQSSMTSKFRTTTTTKNSYASSSSEIPLRSPTSNWLSSSKSLEKDSKSSSGTESLSRSKSINTPALSSGTSSQTPSLSASSGASRFSSAASSLRVIEQKSVSSTESSAASRTDPTSDSRLPSEVSSSTRGSSSNLSANKSKPNSSVTKASSESLSLHSSTKRSPSITGSASQSASNVLSTSTASLTQARTSTVIITSCENEHCFEVTATVVNPSTAFSTMTSMSSGSTLVQTICEEGRCLDSKNAHHSSASNGPLDHTVITQTICPESGSCQESVVTLEASSTITSTPAVAPVTTKTVCPESGACFETTVTASHEALATLTTIYSTATETICPPAGSCHVTPVTYTATCTASALTETRTICSQNECFATTEVHTALSPSTDSVKWTSTEVQTICPTQTVCYTTTVTHVAPTGTTTSMSQGSDYKTPQAQSQSATSTTQTASVNSQGTSIANLGMQVKASSALFLIPVLMLI
ncbi:hypothetical protein PUMCH_004739 [Australozyma saopauloensis]|uniref:Hyphally-regulated cell wall protein N-terminal domain-containing protein n=1 Tax=Australozyma saopauloensis TaxID=291208 RepID=A0AAX4HFH2_9ASCO|nr:hypothetical protein PUMCH_004739 [[Candida] saopauloensis]